MIPAIPDGILEHIFSFLEPSSPLTAEEKATGAACCLVSRCFYPLAQQLLYDFPPSDPALDWCNKCRLGFQHKSTGICLDKEGELVCDTCFAPGRTFGEADADGHYWGDHKRVFEKWTGDTVRDVLDEVKADSSVRGVSKLCREFGGRDPTRQPLPSEIMLMLENKIEGGKPRETLTRAAMTEFPSIMARFKEAIDLAFAHEAAEELAEAGAAEEADDDGEEQLRREHE